jgi:hypothetical protein
VLHLFAQSDSGGGGGAAIVLFLVYALVFVVWIAGMWKTFAKAGEPGWAALIPIYNTYVWLKIVGRPIWWILLFLVPCVSIVIVFIVSIDMAKSFGKSDGYGIGMALLPFIFWTMLGFGDAQYRGPAAAQGAPRY